MSIFAPVAKAQSPASWYHSDFGDWYLKVYDTDTSPTDQIFGERYTAAQVEWIIYGVFSYVLSIFSHGSTDAWVCAIKVTDYGLWDACMTPLVLKLIDTIKNVTNLGYAYQDNTIAAGKNTNPLMTDLISVNRQLSFVSELKRWGGNLHIIPEVKAQEGIGFSRLDIVRNFWKFSRDATYSLIVIAAIIMAFMIMFRVKLSPQTVITVQSAIPKLIIALILITFSYAIAGLLVDLVYVVIGLVAGLFAQGTGVNWTAAYQMMTVGIAGGLIGSLFIYGSMFTFTAAFALISPNSVGDILKSIIGLVLVIILIVVLFFVLLFAAFKAFWTLIKALALFYVTVIFAPFYILAGLVIPAMGFGAWLKATISNLAVFPVVSILFYFAYQFLLYALRLAFGGSEAWTAISDFLAGFGLDIPAVTALGWVPPLLNVGIVPGNINATIFLFTSLAMLLLIPKAADIVKGFLSGRGFAAGSAIGEAFGPAAAAGMGAVGYLSAQQQAAYTRAVKGGGATSAQEAYNRIWSLIRGAAGGRVK